MISIFIILTVSQCKIESNYEKNIISVIDKLENKSITPIKNTSNKLTQKGDFLIADFELLLALNPQISKNFAFTLDVQKQYSEFILSCYHHGFENSFSLYSNDLKKYLHNNYPFEFYRNELKFDEKISNELLELFYKINIDKLNQIQLYSFLSLLVDFSYHLKKNGFTDLHMAAIDFGLFIIETNSFEIEFIKHRAQLNNQKLKEYFEMFVSEEKMDSLYRINLEYSKRINYQDILFELYQINPIDNGSFGTTISLDSIRNLQIALEKKRFLALDTGFYFMDTQYEKAIDYFKYVISTFGSNCNWMKNYAYDLLGVVYGKLGSLILSNTYFDLSSNITGCDEQNTSIIQFSNIQLQMNYAKSIKAKMSPWEIFKTYERQRAISLGVFKNESDHYNDYYVQSIANTLDAFVDEPVMDKSRILQILNLVSSSKSREIKRKKLIDTRNDEKLNNKRITELKLKFNNFLDIENFEDPEREELFKLLLNEKINTEDFKIVSVPDQYDVSNLSLILNDPSAALLDFLEYEDDLFGCLYYNNKLEVVKFETSKVDSLIRKLNLQIFAKSDYNETLLQMKKIFNSVVDRNVELLKIRSDGVVNNLPLHLIFRVPIQLLDNTSDFTKYETQDLSKSKVSFFSFSNDSTLSGRNKKLVPELKYGYAECISISRMLNSEFKIVSASQLTKDNFLYFQKGDVFHLSTHAFSSEDNRYDNFIVLRKSDLTLDTLYSYEIDEMLNVPKLAVISACESGLGKHVNGKGTYDIGRAFINNGAQAVIKSLWKVNDKSTQVFMNELYSQWLTNISLFEALQNTRSYMQSAEFYHPYYWAGFVLEGNGQLYLN